MTERVFEKQTAEYFQQHIGSGLIMRTSDQVMPVGDADDANALFDLQEAGNGTVLFATATKEEMATVATAGEVNEAAATTE